jgi:hypothetical protein
MQRRDCGLSKSIGNKKHLRAAPFLTFSPWILILLNPPPLGPDHVGYSG